MMITRSMGTSMALLALKGLNRICMYFVTLEIPRGYKESNKEASRFRSSKFDYSKFDRA